MFGIRGALARLENRMDIIEDDLKRDQIFTIDEALERFNLRGGDTTQTLAYIANDLYETMSDQQKKRFLRDFRRHIEEVQMYARRIEEDLESRKPNSDEDLPILETSK